MLFKGKPKLTKVKTPPRSLGNQWGGNCSMILGARGVPAHFKSRCTWWSSKMLMSAFCHFIQTLKACVSILSLFICKQFNFRWIVDDSEGQGLIQPGIDNPLILPFWCRAHLMLCLFPLLKLGGCSILTSCIFSPRISLWLLPWCFRQPEISVWSRHSFEVFVKKAHFSSGPKGQREVCWFFFYLFLFADPMNEQKWISCVAVDS